MAPQRPQYKSMILIKSILVFIMLFNSTSYSTAIKKSKTSNSDASSVKQAIERVPIVDVKISLIDTVIKYGDKILLNISLTNNGNKEQKLLFDKPVITTGGPWETIGYVIDAKTKLSVLELNNKAMLCSQIITEDQLIDEYYHLKPGQSINRRYDLTDIVVINFKDDLLPRGTYEVQLLYYTNQSNIVTFKIQ